MERRFFAWIVMPVMLIAQAYSQSSAAAGQWFGSITCQLDIQVQGYARHEIQTWTLTGEAPKYIGTSGVAEYPATWNYTGQGALQRVDGARTINAQWALNVIPAEARLRFSSHDGALLINRAGAQQQRFSGLTGQRYVAVNGVPQQPAALTSFTLWEWALPLIEVAPSSSVTGTLSVRTELLGGELQQSGPPPPATCKYQFSQGSDSTLTASSSAATASTQPESSAVTSIQQIGPGNRSIQQMPLAPSPSTSPGLQPPPGQSTGTTNGLPPAPPVGASQNPVLNTQFPSWDQTLPAPGRWSRLANFNNKAVLDRNTGLVWETAPEQMPMTWGSAKEHCFERVVGGQMGFRLPAVSELTSLLNPSVPEGINKLVSPNWFDLGPKSELGFLFWSGTHGSLDDGKSYAYRVSVANGTVRGIHTDALSLPHDALGIGSSTLTTPTGFAWCVRGGLNPSD